MKPGIVLNTTFRAEKKHETINNDNISLPLILESSFVQSIIQSILRRKGLSASNLYVKRAQ